MTIEYLETTATASLRGSIILVTSFHYSHFICSVRSLETPFSCFIFCRTVSLCAVAILHTLLPLPDLPQLLSRSWAGNSCNKIFRKMGFKRYLSLVAPSPTCHLSHQLLHASGPISSRALDRCFNNVSSVCSLVPSYQMVLCPQHHNCNIHQYKNLGSAVQCRGLNLDKKVQEQL